MLEAGYSSAPCFFGHVGNEQSMGARSHQCKLVKLIHAPP
jgi:hypothetical protein